MQQALWRRSKKCANTLTELDFFETMLSSG
jgi:hypothetical protein